MSQRLPWTAREAALHVVRDEQPCKRAEVLTGFSGELAPVPWLHLALWCLGLAAAVALAWAVHGSR